MFVIAFIYLYVNKFISAKGMLLRFIYALTVLSVYSTLQDLYYAEVERLRTDCVLCVRR